MVDSQGALRISQLDAGELDSQLFDILLSQLTSAFRFFKPGFLVKYSPEVKVALKYILWKYTLSSQGVTVGQKLLDLRYHNLHASGSTSPWITPRQKQLLAICTILLPWLQDRLPDVSPHIREKTGGEKMLSLLSWLEKLWRLASLINFLVFLQQGTHQYLLERVLGIRPVFPKPQSVRQVGFDLMNRELLWHGFAEFLFFILPLVNFRRVKNFVMRKCFPKSAEAISAQRSAADYKECAVCGEWPNAPHQIGCKHVFCYVCVQGNLLADPDYQCPLCEHRVTSSPEPVKIYVATS